MKKKVLALLLCATMVMGLAACGSKEVSSEVPAEETGVEENAEGVEGTTIKLSSWHLTDDAPEELKKEFAEYMKEQEENTVEQVV